MCKAKMVAGNTEVGIETKWPCLQTAVNLGKDTTLILSMGVCRGRCEHFKVIICIKFDAREGSVDQCACLASV